MKGKVPTCRVKATRQKGAILPMFIIGLAFILGMAGLAIDSSHSFVNVTRLQNALDAAALSAGRTLNSSLGDETLADAHGTTTFNQHLASNGGDNEMADSLNISFEYSIELIPFVPNITANPSRYVRATVTNHTIPVWFARVLPGVGNTTTIGTTAVSGPIPVGSGTGEVCDIAPLVVCGTPPTEPPAPAVPNEIFGLSYGKGENYCLKASSNVNNYLDSMPDECEPPDDHIGPGNFQLLDLGCLDGPGGGACVRTNLAGENSNCEAKGDTVETKPGNTVGPTSQGFNTRFGIYQGPVNATDHPPDFYTSPLTYTQYTNKYDTKALVDEPNGLANRRVMSVPIGDCTPPLSGQSTIKVLGFGCFFMTEKIRNTGPEGKESWIIGELVDRCEASGDIGYTPDVTDPSAVNFRIILYNDPDNLAS